MQRIRKIFLVLFIILSVAMPSFAVLSQDKKKEIIALYNSNNLDEAYFEISKITESDRDYELWYLLANISQDRGNNTNAVFFLQKSLNKPLHVPHVILAVILILSLFSNSNFL